MNTTAEILKLNNDGVSLMTAGKYREASATLIKALGLANERTEDAQLSFDKEQQVRCRYVDLSFTDKRYFSEEERCSHNVPFLFTSPIKVVYHQGLPNEQDPQGEQSPHCYKLISVLIFNLAMVYHRLAIEIRSTLDYCILQLPWTEKGAIMRSIPSSRLAFVCTSSATKHPLHAVATNTNKVSTSGSLSPSSTMSSRSTESSKTLTLLGSAARSCCKLLCFWWSTRSSTLSRSWKAF
mmetsp:Transcript_20927/g.36773  ORF Transcript_20927/g.36773 Transcript_20927/m.36773 type:complete len:238 (+) Transcript_20927:387-1100(+)